MEVDEPSKSAADAAATETVKPVVLVRLLVCQCVVHFVILYIIEGLFVCECVCMMRIGSQTTQPSGTKLYIRRK